MAHLVEHVTFLGSSKRERLLGTGARSNAYTDFHHTVFHVHSPLVDEQNPYSRKAMLPEVYQLLYLPLQNLNACPHACNECFSK